MTDEDEEQYNQLEILLKKEFDSKPEQRDFIWEVIQQLADKQNEGHSFDMAVEHIRGCITGPLGKFRPLDGVIIHLLEWFEELVTTAKDDAANIISESYEESIYEQIQLNQAPGDLRYVGMTNSGYYLPLRNKRPGSGRSHIRKSLLQSHSVNPLSSAQQRSLHVRHRISYSVLSTFLVGMLTLIHKDKLEELFELSYPQLLDSKDKKEFKVKLYQALEGVMTTFGLPYDEIIRDISRFDEDVFIQCLEDILETVAWKPVNLFLGPAAHNLAVSSNFDSGDNDAILKSVLAINESLAANRQRALDNKEDYKPVGSYAPYGSSIDRVVDDMKNTDPALLENVECPNQPEPPRPLEYLEAMMEHFVMLYMSYIASQNQNQDQEMKDDWE